MITTTQATKLVLNTVVALMLFLTTIALAHGFNVPTGWYPFSFATYLKAVGYVFVIAAIAEVFLKRGAMGRWGFAFIFAVSAFRILSLEELSTEFPTTSEGQFGLAICAGLLSFGAMHLVHRPKKKINREMR